MPNYEELVRLEIECNNLDLIYPKIPIKPSYGTGWIIFTVIGLLLGGVIGIFIFIPRMVYVSKKQKIWTQEYEDTMKNRIEIENKQKSISERAKILLK